MPIPYDPLNVRMYPALVTLAPPAPPLPLSYTSPVPIYIVAGVTGSIAIAPTPSTPDIVGTYVQLIPPAAPVPPVVVFHKPPLAVPAHIILALVGWKARLITLPAKFIGAIAVQVPSAEAWSVLAILWKLFMRC